MSYGNRDRNECDSNAKTSNAGVDEFLIVQVVARVRRTAPQVEIVDVN